MSFSFQFELGRPEQVRACRVIYHRRWTTRLTYAFFLVMGAVVIWLQWRDGCADDAARSMFISVCAVTAGMAAVYLTPVFTVRSFRKKNRSVTGLYLYSLTETGIDAQAPGMSSSVLWANVVEVYETPHFIFFYLSAALAMVLPKRAIEDTELPALKNALRQWTGDRAHLQP